MENKSLAIEFILDEIFFNKTEEAIKKMEEYDLFGIIDNNISHLNSKLESNTFIDFNTIAVSFLLSMNSKINIIKDTEDKEYLKYIISNIGNYLIDKFLTEGIIDFKGLKELESSFSTLCELQGYNYSDLDNRVQLKRIISALESQNSNVVTTKDIYYEWNGKDYLLDDITKNLKSENSIASTKEFRKLFSTSPPDKVRFQNGIQDFLVVLFDTLYEKKILKPKGVRGHFALIYKCAVDLDNNILFKKEPKHINYSIKKNKEKYRKLRAKAENWIK